MIPTIGAGYLIHMVSHDELGYKESGDYEYTSNTYFDPHFTAKLTFDIAFGQSFHIFLEPGYTMFFEQDGSGSMAGANAGFKICF